MKEGASRVTSLKTEAKYFFEILVDFQRTTWRYIPEFRTLNKIYSFQKSFYYKTPFDRNRGQAVRAG
jgi:hypothetical protein